VTSSRGQCAVIAAILAANGENERAQAAVASIDTNLLAPAKYALIAPIRMR